MARSLTLRFARTLRPAAASTAAPAPATTIAASFTLATLAARFATFAALRRAGVATTAAVSTFRRSFRLGQKRLAGQTQASALIALDQLHLDPVALLDHVLGLLGATPLHLRDVQQTLGARHDLDKCAERRRRLDRALVDLPDDRLGGDRLHHLAGPLHRVATDGSDRDHTVVVHGDLRARLVLDATDGLAFRADQIADLLGIDVDRHD